MTNLLIWAEILSIFLYIPFWLGVGLGVVWAVRIKVHNAPGIKIMYETDIDSVKVEE